jgi:hypothetical protein
MRRMLLAVLALALPTAGLANTISFFISNLYERLH